MPTTRQSVQQSKPKGKEPKVAPSKPVGKEPKNSTSQPKGKDSKESTPTILEQLTGKQPKDTQNKNPTQEPQNNKVNNPYNAKTTTEKTNKNPKENKQNKKQPYNALSSTIKSVLKNGGTQQKRGQYQASLRRDSKRINQGNNINNKKNNKPSVQAKTKFRSRVTFKILIPASDNPVNKASKIMMDLLSQIKDTSDSDACYIPWCEKDESTIDIIDDPTDVPTKLSELSKYFPRLFPGRPHQQNVVYTKVYLGHNDIFDNINSDIKYWLMSGSHGLYFNMLQAENTETIGWLLYSTYANDAGALAEDMYDKFQIQVGLRWMTISSGTRGKIPPNQQVKALHVEAIKSEKSTIKKALLKIYSRISWSRNTDLPSGMKLRFVTMRKDATSPHSITKLDRLRQRQKGFLSSIIKSEQNWDVLHLDYRIRDNTPTLREMIMNIRSATHDTNLYLSVDLDWQKSGFVFQYLPEVKDEASSMTHTLYPYLLWELDLKREEDYDSEDEDDTEPLTADELQKFFDGDALLRMEDMVYDPIKKSVIDKDVDNYLEFIDDEDLLGNKFDTTPDTATEDYERPEPKALESNIYKGSDDDSISTLGASVYNSPTGRQRTKPRRVRLMTDKQEDDITTLSTASTPTIETIKAIETRLEDLTTHNNKMFDQILQRLSSPSNTDEISQSSSGTTDAGDASSLAGDGR